MPVKRAVMASVVLATLAVATPAVAAKQPKEQATVRQVARVVALHEEALLDAIPRIESQCRGATCFPDTGDEVQAFAANVAALRAALEAIDDRDDPGYVGTVPKELRKLVADTTAAAATIEEDAPNFTYTGGLSSGLEAAMEDLERLVQRWKRTR